MNKYIPLSKACKYSSVKIKLGEITLDSYITTDNLLQNKQGVTTATNLPPQGNSFPKYDTENILVGNIRPYLKKIWFATNDGGCSSDVLVFDVKKGFHPKFVYYAMFQDDFFVHAMKGSKGTKMPRGDKNQIMEYKIPDIDFNSQKQIANVLSSIDSKIALNNRINAELEAMAKTVYDYWFVQFEFPFPSTSSGSGKKGYKSSGGKMVWCEELKREVPEGWEVKSLGSLGNFKNGVNYDPSIPGDVACPIINVRNISASSYFLKNEDLDVIYLKASDVRKYAVHEGSIIIARSGIPGATRLISDIAANTLYCGFAIHYELEDLSLKTPIFFFLKSIEQQIQNGSGGTIMKNVNQGTLNALQIALPTNNDTISEFNKVIDPIFGKINLIQQENQQLSSLRDWLLPMLMNGQVSVGVEEI